MIPSYAEHIFIIETIIAFLLFSIGLTYYLDRRRAKKLPHTKPFKWGYLHVSICWFASFQCLLALVLNQIFPFPADSSALLVAMMVIFLFEGYLFWCREKWAWVLGTILTLNIVHWIINYYYGENRWHEFGIIEDLPYDSVNEKNIIETSSKEEAEKKKSYITGGCLLILAFLFFALTALPGYPIVVFAFLGLSCLILGIVAFTKRQ